MLVILSLIEHSAQLRTQILTCRPLNAKLFKNFIIVFSNYYKIVLMLYQQLLLDNQYTYHSSMHLNKTKYNLLSVYEIQLYDTAEQSHNTVLITNNMYAIQLIFHSRPFYGACIRACERACVHACTYACMSACVCAILRTYKYVRKRNMFSIAIASPLSNVPAIVVDSGLSY